ncbi:CapA family protein [Candidatus Uhrbacteria bacterium]|nr:CapA family protein [Candidatus Uhrbacteria bacterium]
MERVSPARIAVSTLIGTGLGLIFISVLWLYAPQPIASRMVEIKHIPLLDGDPYPLSGRGFEIEDEAIRIRFVGDIMLDRTVASRTRQSGNPSYPFLKLPTDWLATPDYSVVNLEGPVTDRRRSPEKSIDFMFDPSWLPRLKELGIDAVSQANNHALDQGTAGYEDSISRLRASGFTTFGHQVLDDSVALATTTIRGLRVAFFGYNTTDNPLDRASASSVLAEARSSSDLVIAFLHWGSEYRSKPDASSVDTAHWLIDHGVDVVIGGHPHWTQGLSVYKGKPIAWSLGNFIFDQDWSLETRQGMSVDLLIQGDNLSFELHPLSIVESQPAVLTGIQKTQRLEYVSEISDPELAGQVKEGMIRF